MAKKKFGISPSVNRALTQTIQMAEAENSNFMNTEILVERIILDPENPRKHRITLQDIETGISKSDPDVTEKQAEYEDLCQLSASIEKEGLLHPIIVVEDANNFRLVAGERRFFATLMAKKKVIEARVFKKKPRAFDLKVIQWSENQARKDLSLYKKLLNVQAIISVFENERGEPMTAIKLSEILAVSRQQAQFYKAILSNEALLAFIRDGKISTLEMARQLCSANESQIISLLESNHSAKKPVRVLPRDKSKRTGRKRTSVNLGATKKSVVVKAITQAMLKITELQKYEREFQTIDWSCFNDSTKAFHRLIKILEKELGEKV